MVNDVRRPPRANEGQRSTIERSLNKISLAQTSRMQVAGNTYNVRNGLDDWCDGSQISWLTPPPTQSERARSLVGGRRLEGTPTFRSARVASEGPVGWSSLLMGAPDCLTGANHRTAMNFRVFGEPFWRPCRRHTGKGGSRRCRGERSRRPPPSVGMRSRAACAAERFQPEGTCQRPNR